MQSIVEAGNDEATFAYKDYLVFLPVLASTLALIFDVGYFSAIDINLFTLFSLTEHIVFSIEALPLAIGLMLGAYSGLWAIRYLDRFVGRPVIATTIGSGRSPRRKEKLVLWTVLLISISAIGAALLLVPLSGWALTLFCSLCIVIAIYAPRIGIRVGALSIAVLAAAYGFGYISAAEYLHPPEDTFFGRKRVLSGTTITTTSDESIQARIIRSGDRGVLFVDSRGRVTLLRWDNIKLIVRGGT